MWSRYSFMVICYRFMVSSLQFYGHLLQKYGAIHRHPALLLQIYGLKPSPPRWMPFCYRFMVADPARALATDLWSRPPPGILLQIYGR